MSYNDIRKDLINKVEKEIENEELHVISRDYIIKKYKNQKNGIYFLYDENDTVIYVGRVGNGSYTSFYHRMYGHGSGRHANKSWFKEAKKFRFKSFPDLNDKQMSQLERLMIYAKQQPKYNDCPIYENDIIVISKKIEKTT